MTTKKTSIDPSVDLKNELEEEFTTKLQQRKSSSIHTQASNLHILLHFGNHSAFLKRYFIILPIASITIILSTWVPNIYIAIVDSQESEMKVCGK